MNALIEAEELGISSKNVNSLAQSPRPGIQRFLGKSGDFGTMLGAAGNDWAANIVKTLGNYGEVYERHLGAGSGINLPRGVNKLWSQGGIMYSTPFR